MSDIDNNDAGESNAPAPAEGGDDRIKNLKSEFDRKLDTRLSAIDEKFQQILASIQPKEPAAPAAPANNQRSRPSVYEDEERFAQSIKQEAATEVSQQVQQYLQTRDRIQQTVTQLENDFPELRDTNSDVYKKAVERAKQMPQYLRGTPEGIKMAALETIAEAGLVPVSKRRSSGGDDFVISGSSSTSRTRRNADVKPSDVQVGLASLYGAPTNDPQFTKLLEQAVKRNGWNSYE